MKEHVQAIADAFADSHKTSFETWVGSLLDRIMENIVEFNPKLRDMSESIRQETARLEDLGNRRQKLEDYTEQIRRMMDWRAC